MTGVNKVILIGNLGKDPEMFTNESGRNKVRLTVATNEVYRNKTGDFIEHTEWHSVVVWGPLADRSAKVLKKGDHVYVEGKIRLRSWEEGGKKRYFTEIEARRLTLLNNKKDEKPAAVQGNEVPPHIPDKLDTEPDYNPEEDEFPF